MSLDLASSCKNVGDDAVMVAQHLKAWMCRGCSCLAGTKSTDKTLQFTPRCFTSHTLSQHNLHSRRVLESPIYSPFDSGLTSFCPYYPPLRSLQLQHYNKPLFAQLPYLPHPPKCLIKATQTSISDHGSTSLPTEHWTAQNLVRLVQYKRFAGNVAAWRDVILRTAFSCNL